ncbi:MAG: alpha/beta hydrolase [Muribaculum sp.]|nr:alpha/beta hydrolase [Muribaculum sp.]
MRKFLFLLLIALLAGVGSAFSERFFTSWQWQHLQKPPEEYIVDTAWGPDILPGFESRFVDQGRMFDGPCRSTVIRRLSPHRSRKAFLYIHGFNDYFFQREMGERFVDSGYNFYAVDLRRYGRSRLPWQYPFNVRNQREYFRDIDSALAQIRRDGNTDITLGGHSTGGLTVILFAAERGARAGVDRVVTDSPFLEWNFSPFMRNLAIPAVALASHLSPDAKIKQSRCDGYAYSLLRQYHGEWEYNTDWKMIYSPPVTMSWIRSINNAQSKAIKYGRNIVVPLLVMHSSRKIDGCNWTPEFQTGDCVLDPHEIQRQGMKLGQPSSRTVCTIDSGLHDLILSSPHVRQAAYDSIFKFIRNH